MKEKEFKKVRFLLLNIIIALLSLIFIFGNTADVYVVGTINDAGLKNAYVTRIMDIAFDNLGSDAVDKLEKIQQDLESREEIRNITLKYTEAYIEGIAKDKSFDEIDVDISEDMNSLMEFVSSEIRAYINMPSFLGDALEKAIMSKETAVQNAVVMYASSVYAELQVSVAPMVKAYYILTSKQVLIGLLIVILLLLAGLIMTTPVSVLKISVPVLSGCVGIIYYIIANIILGKVVFATSNELLGRTASLNTTPGYMVLGIMAGISAASFAVFAAADIFIKKRNKISSEG